MEAQLGKKQVALEKARAEAQKHTDTVMAEKEALTLELAVMQREVRELEQMCARLGSDFDSQKEKLDGKVQNQRQVKLCGSLLMIVQLTLTSVLHYQRLK